MQKPSRQCEALKKGLKGSSSCQEGVLAKAQGDSNREQVGANSRKAQVLLLSVFGAFIALSYCLLCWETVMASREAPYLHARIKGHQRSTVCSLPSLKGILTPFLPGLLQGPYTTSGQNFGSSRIQRECPLFTWAGMVPRGSARNGSLAASSPALMVSDLRGI